MNDVDADEEDYGESSCYVADYFMEVGLPNTLSVETESSRQLPVKYPIIAITCEFSFNTKLSLRLLCEFLDLLIIVSCS